MTPKDIAALRPVAPLQCRALLEKLRELGDFSPATREAISRAVGDTTPLVKRSGYWFPVALTNEVVLEDERLSGGLFQFCRIDGTDAVSAQQLADMPAGAPAGLVQAMAQHGLGVLPGPAQFRLGGVPLDGWSWTLAAAVAVEAATAEWRPSGVVVITGELRSTEQGAVTGAVRGLKEKLDAIERELEGAHVFACAADAADERRRREKVTVHVVPEGTSPEQLFRTIRALEERDKRRHHFARELPAWTTERLPAPSLPIRNRAKDGKQPSALVRLGATVRVSAEVLDAGKFPGWQVESPRSALGWLSKMDPAVVLARTPGAFHAHGHSPLVLSANLGALKQAQGELEGCRFRLESVDLVPTGPGFPGSGDGLREATLGMVLEVASIDLEGLLGLTAARNAPWKETLARSNGKQQVAATLSGLLETLVAAFNRGEPPPIPGAGSGEAPGLCSRKSPEALLPLFQAAWVDLAEIGDAERQEAWDLFAGVARKLDRNTMAPVVHWPPAPHGMPPHRGTLYGHHDKAVSFWVADDTEYSLNQKKDVLMKSHYLHWLLVLRRNKLGLPAFTRADLAAQFSESHHRGYVEWLEARVRWEPATH